MGTWIEGSIAERGGAVSFREFMELALYHPQHGYYESREPRFGRNGDFMTAPSASRWYAMTLARLLSSLAQRRGRLTLVDVASGDGSFVSGVLSFLGARAGGVLTAVLCAERSQSLRCRLRLQLERWAVATSVVPSCEELEPAPGPVVVHASELYDALPVHRVVAQEGGLAELWVETTAQGLGWRDRPARAELLDYLRAHRVDLVPGQVAEINLEARSLHRSLLERAGRDAVVLCLDYGHGAPRLYDHRGRRGGSLACYRNHELSRDPLANPGEQDITAHVNWDDLRGAAADAGWHEIALTSLAELLVRAGIADAMEDCGVGVEAPLDARTLKERQEIKRLLDPEGMGSDLKMLIQGVGPLADTLASRL